ncbi:hypothetical protein [Pseudonocardia sp. ICBG1142]|uniref:hypothetical protein n=1 Tax=Pseudonocardia sp. ICBG1142 TaxID=2846760 RepID=UPI001CF688B1|nr:hypothetical protein [Pseudonocardia sp. ICBG1142]
MSETTEHPDSDSDSDDPVMPALPPQTLADRLNRAFATLHPADRGPYSNREVIRWLQANSTPEQSIPSLNYLGLLRSGEATDPTVGKLQSIARFFKIPATYFIEDNAHSDAVQADLQLLDAMRDTQVREIAARAVQLDPSIRDWLIDTIRRLPDLANGPPPRTAQRQRIEMPVTDKPTKRRRRA